METQVWLVSGSGNLTVGKEVRPCQFIEMTLFLEKLLKNKNILSPNYQKSTI
jgi:hypothetical protein